MMKRMPKSLLKISMKGKSKRICATICCVLAIFALNLQVQRISAASAPQIVFDQTIKLLTIGQNFTLTINLTDYPNLYTWQVVLRYNGSVVNLTDISIPTDNVFAGRFIIPIEQPLDTQAPGDRDNKLNFTIFGASLRGDESVSVSNGVLCEATFTAMATGETAIAVMTNDNPVHDSLGAAWATFVLDPDLVPYEKFSTVSCTAVVGDVGNIAPVAIFTGFSPPVDNVTHLVLNMNPAGAQRWVDTYLNFITVFDASASHDIDGHITQYIWNFGDGNITVVNATSPASANVTHVFTTTGKFVVTLTVVDDGNPAKNLAPLESAPYQITVPVGIVLTYYNWNPLIYTVIGIVAAATVIYAIRGAVKFARRRRELKRQKMLATSGRPPTGAVAE
jgi:hypothetical protein